MAKILGINDDVSTCQCCGKTGLKRVVWLDLEDGSDPVAYGTSCAGMALYGRKNQTNTKLAMSRASAIEFLRQMFIKYADKDRAERREQAIQETAMSTGYAFRSGIVNNAGKVRILPPWVQPQGNDFNARMEAETVLSV